MQLCDDKSMYGVLPQLGLLLATSAGQGDSFGKSLTRILATLRVYIYIYIYIYRVSQKKPDTLRSFEKYLLNKYDFGTKRFQHVLATI